MVPDPILLLENMPLTPNGKVDRKQLPKPEVAKGHDSQPPNTELEKSLCQIWREVFELDDIGITDSFFALGGHSILALKIVSRVRSQLELELPLRGLFERPTIMQLAQYLENQTTQLASTPSFYEDNDIESGEF